jgi:hypothetical protein
MSLWEVVVFRSTHLAVKAERAVLKSGIDCKLVPAPRHLSHDCGVVLRFHATDRTLVETILRDNQIDYELIASEEG